MSETERELLRLIRAEWDRVAALSGVRDFRLDVTEWISRSTAIRDMRAGLGIRVGSQWIGTSEADRQARRRALLSLERLGLVELHAAFGRKITHVRLVGGKLPPVPPPSPLRPTMVEHVPTGAQLRHAKLVAWSLECKAKEAAKREAGQRMEAE